MTEETNSQPAPEPETVLSRDIAVRFCTVRFTVGWLPASIGLTDAAKLALTSGRNIEKRVIRGSYAILGASRDPLIKEGLMLKRLLTTIRDMYTVPEFTMRASAPSDKPKMPVTEKVHGSYIIEGSRVEEFLNRFEEARQAYLRWGQRLAQQENYDRIRSADEQALGDDWEIVASKYPSAASMADAISCEVPRVDVFDSSFALADIAPNLVLKLQTQARERLEASVDGAVSELVYDLRTMVETVARNCGTRIRVRPEREGEYGKYIDAEVVTIRRNHDDPDIPEGQVLLELQPVTAGSEGGFKNSGSVEKLMMAEQAYIDFMRPLETSEQKVLTESAFANVIDLTSRIQKVRTILAGDPETAASLDSLVDKVTGSLTKLGGSAGAITGELRKSQVLRGSVRETFATYAQDLLQTQIQLKERIQGRRLVSMPKPEAPKETTPNESPDNSAT